MDLSYFEGIVSTHALIETALMFVVVAMVFLLYITVRYGGNTQKLRRGNAGMSKKSFIALSSDTSNALTEVDPDIYIAKTPILNNSHTIVGYGISNAGTVIDDTSLTHVVNLYSSGLIEDRVLYVPITEDLLHNKDLSLLPHGSVFILPLFFKPETKDKRIDQCEALIQQGYRFAVQQTSTEKPAKFSEFSIIEFTKAFDSIRQCVTTARDHSSSIMMTCINDTAAFEFGQSLGVNLYQGFYFSKLDYIETATIDSKTSHTMTLMNMVLEHCEPEEIEEAFKVDPDLTYKLLKYINSAAIGLRTEVRSIKAAILALGYEKLARWLGIFMMSSESIQNETKDAIFELSALRGRNMELLGKHYRQSTQTQDALFMAGMFSLFDQVLKMPIEEALGRLNLPEAVTQLLFNDDGPYKEIYDIALAAEQGDTLNLDEGATSLTLSTLSAINAESNAWVKSLMG